MAPKNLLCFSHLRWDFLLQRPQQLLLRFAEDTNIYYVENPVFDANEEPYFSFGTRSETLWKMVPHLRPGLTSSQIIRCMRQLIDAFLEKANLEDWTFWYYTAAALSFTKKYKPGLTVYDCMDEVSMFRRCPEDMGMLEKKLVEKADLIFTQGYTLTTSKKVFHPHVHPFPFTCSLKATVQNLSWNDTFTGMSRLIREASAGKKSRLKSFKTKTYTGQAFNIF
ncbi:glycosyltransferase family protein [Pedobacter cryoconitis]|uniref:Glycosyltransferase family 1 protein n=1 Tax=Pedobacter cryoconitis TaxID=188932 RepID=A0A327S3P4_9SPHI|nr:hypothetical protein [Pedobacter cryoconitis]RAJ22203.1 hypothetical protein LY11_04895 [Pedobacter cryoconitis]